jgi:beta-galactosidase
MPARRDGQILVPFAIESPLSGVGKRFGPDDALWYRRTVVVEQDPGRRCLLHVEAVDYPSTLWVNDTRMGTRTGGNLPFSFDVTDALQRGENTLTLRVTDATDTAYQLHGKQRLNPRRIWYTPVSGIWQTVWMEQVPASGYVTHLPGARCAGSAALVPRFSHPLPGDRRARR